MPAPIKSLVRASALLIGLLVVGGPVAFGQTVSLVRDFNSGPTGAFPGQFTASNGIKFFTATDGVNGRELWRTDGTSIGTFMVKDIVAGAEWSSPEQLTDVDGTLFFTAITYGIGGEPLGRELWKSDGSTAGTVLVADINPGPDDSESRQFISFNGALFFRANDGTNGSELWKSDGTTTEIVKDIRVGSGGSGVSWMTVLGVELFFRANDGVWGNALWKSDGTAGGTVLVRSFGPGDIGLNPIRLTVSNGVLFFAGQDSTNGRELWKSDGTDAGTMQVADINPGSAGSDPSFLIDVDGTLFFRANDGTNGIELWKSDGSAADTVMVEDINPGASSANPIPFADYGGTLFFRADDGVNGFELWKSDGTAAGTMLVKDINPSGSSAPVGSVANGVLFLSADDGVNGRELWKSDGTAAGTVLLQDINPDGSSGPAGRDADGILLFAAYNGVTGRELWKSDGTAAGTVLVKDIRTNVPNGNPSNLTRVGDTIFFRSFEPASGQELWKSDGTQDGTVLVRDINLGSESSNLQNLISFNGELYFAALAHNNSGEPLGRELWKSDGTIGGTVMVKDIRLTEDTENPGGNLGSNPDRMTVFNGELFFRADDGEHGYALWRSNGTDAGTVLVRNLAPEEAGANPGLLTVSNGILFFVGQDDGTNGRELWKSDGTDAGTMQVADINPGPAGSQANWLSDIGGTLFFRANDGTNGPELWKSDGTAAGTVLVKDIHPGAGARILGFRDVGGTAFFRADDGFNGLELWKSDGDPANPTGTVMVKDINTSGDGRPFNLRDFLGKLYFFADTGTNEWELWESDGTSAGTLPVKGFDPNPNTNFPFWLTPVGDTLVFAADNGTTGRELWTSDGATAGTLPVEDIWVGPDGSNPGGFHALGGMVLFPASDGTNGRELWLLELPDADEVTPIGEDVIVAPVDPVSGEAPVSLGFEEVVEGGDTTVEVQVEGPPPPDGFNVADSVYFDIETTAEFEGLVQVCFDYGGFTIDENNLNLLHFVAENDPLTAGGVCDNTHPDYNATALGCWEDVTQESPIPTGEGFQNEGQPNPDTVNDIVCGMTASLSPFILAESQYVEGPDDPVEVGTGVTASVFFTNPDAVSVEWDWGDGSDDAASDSFLPGEKATGSHPYTEPGVYAIQATLRDAGGAPVGAPIFRYVVVYDPEGGFVTGGGWILSPEGAYRANTELFGKAHFGFVSKYKNGASTPTGNTEFQFQAAGLNFHSTSYDWLVIAGNKAQFKGEGRVNGLFGSDDESGYSFILTATDGDAKIGGDGIDKFRIKISDKAPGGGVIYDNKPGKPDDISNADPQEIMQGSIVVHKKE